MAPRQPASGQLLGNHDRVDPRGSAWGISAAMKAMLAAALWSYGGAPIVVEDGWLHAGRAKIELKFVGPSGLWIPLRHARCRGRSRTHAATSCFGPTSPGQCALTLTIPTVRPPIGSSAPGDPQRSSPHSTRPVRPSPMGKPRPPRRVIVAHLGKCRPDRPHPVCGDHGDLAERGRH